MEPSLRSSVVSVLCRKALGVPQRSLRMRLIRSVFGLKNDRKTQTTRRTRLCRRFSPSLELLEGRLVPAGTFHWTGAASDVWSLAANWNLTAGDGTFPGANGGTGDTAVFERTP